MSETAMTAAKILNVLPESDQQFALEFIKRLLLAWDPDFTKLTSEEAELLQKAENSGFVDEADINWDDLSNFG